MNEHRNENNGHIQDLLLVLSGILFVGMALITSTDGVAEAGLPDKPEILGTDACRTSAVAATDYSGPHIQASASLTIYLPIVFSADVCAPIPDESYSSISVLPPVTDRPAAEHADLNLALRSYIATSAYLGLVDLSGDTDSNAPQLAGLFEDNRTGIFRTVHRVYDWNWGTNSRGAPLSDPPVTLAGLGTSAGEIIRVPSSGYNIGSELFVPERGVMVGAGGFEVLVLYATAERITLKYTREDNVISGYTLHIEGICVEPNLLALYQYWNEHKRSNLPALRSGQGIGRAKTTEIGVAIRDCGTFMEPRSRKDWWQGR